MLNRLVCMAGPLPAGTEVKIPSHTHTHTSFRLNQDWIKHLNAKICVMLQTAETAAASQLFVHSSHFKYILNTTSNILNTPIKN